MRHLAQFIRWRPDGDPRSCFGELDYPVRFDLAEISTAGSTSPDVAAKSPG